MRLIIMGPPGAGKGSQASKIVKHYNVPHISTGDMFREAIKNETELGLLAKSYMDKGALVPDEVTIGLVKERFMKDDCKENGFLLDGFPRNIAQAEALDKMLAEIGWSVDKVINIEVASELLINRVIGRRVCKKCGETFHIEYNKPKVEGICDVCGSELTQRKDDTYETIKNRLDVYDLQTKPLLDYYNKQNLVFNVDGSKSFEEVFNQIKENLGDK